MKFNDLINVYKDAQKRYGQKVYYHISEILEITKEKHRENFSGKDHEQSWKSFKGKNLEKLIEYILQEEVEKLGLALINGNVLERTLDKNLSIELCRVRRNLSIHYGKYGLHLPDADIIIYQPKTSKVVAILSIKTTLRERIAQTGYWKKKLLESPITEHIKVYFITPDEDGTLLTVLPHKKGRAIVEYDTDGGFVMSAIKIEETDNVKMFDKFFDELKKLSRVKK